MDFNAGGVGLSIAMLAPLAGLLAIAQLPSLAWGLEVKSMLSDAIQKKKAYSYKKCLANIGRELNFAVVPSECHEEMQHFYCSKVRDVSSKRYTELFAHNCSKTGLVLATAELKPTAYKQLGIGFVILSHQYPENVKRLIMRLWEPHSTTFAVHVDVKNPDMTKVLSAWVEAERMSDVVTVFSDFNVVRGGSAMLNAELQGIRVLLNSSLPWGYCILLSEQDYPLRSNSVLAEWLWVHRGSSFISVDESECERDLSFQCGDRVVSMSGGQQYPKVPGMRYGSGSQWFAITQELAARVVEDLDRPFSVIGTIYRDLLSVKQPDESFFQAIILNSEFCNRHIDYVMHWTDKDSFREVRSDTSAYNILSPGVLGDGEDYLKLAEVRSKSLWAFFARKFDSSWKSEHLRNKLDQSAGEQSQTSWAPVQPPAVGRLTETLFSSMSLPLSIDRAGRNKDGLFAFQTLRIGFAGQAVGRKMFIREKWASPKEPHDVLSIRVGCSWNKTELVFDGDVSIVSSNDAGDYSCESLWAVLHWRMSKKPVSRELLLVWVDPLGTPMQHVPIKIQEMSVVLWHRYTASLPLPKGTWKIEIMTPERMVVARRFFYVYHRPEDVPWHVAHEYFEALHVDPTA